MKTKKSSLSRIPQTGSAVAGKVHPFRLRLNRIMKKLEKNNRASRSAGETIDDRYDVYIRDAKGRILTHGLWERELWKFLGDCAKAAGCTKGQFIASMFKGKRKVVAP